MPVVSRGARHPLLLPLVHRLWWAGPTPGRVPTPTAARGERILPTGQAQIVISAGARGSVLVGPMSRSADIQRHDGETSTGVSFHAGGVQAFLDVPVEESLDSVIDLGAVWRSAHLADRIDELDPGAALDLLEAELVERFRPDRISRRVLAAERAIRSEVPSSAVPALLGEDRRSLVPEFRRIVGVGPKHYERIRRFGRSVEAVRRKHPDSLASIAVDLGYADQAHFAREFTHFSGVAPSRVVGDVSRARNHLDTDKIFKT